MKSLFLSTLLLLILSTTTLLAKHVASRLTRLTQQHPSSSYLNNKEMNLVNIAQIGNNNTIQANITSLHNQFIDYSQQGIENHIDIYSKNQDTYQGVYQLGNQNNYSFYNYNSFETQNMQVVQQGDRQNLEIFGENSMSKDMSIHMTGKQQTILIRNLK